MGSERMPAAKGGDKAKAKGVAKAITKGVKTVQKKIRTNIRFHLPKTLSKPREGKYPRKYRASPNRLDRYQILKYPLTTESAMKKIEENNTLVFIVDVRASKVQIKEAIKKMYDIDTQKINTLIRPDGQKKAYVSNENEEQVKAMKLEMERMQVEHKEKTI